MDFFVFLQIDVAGTLQFWGVSIDTASSVLLILCFGLAVDYSAHVGHAFMTVPGTKNGIRHCANMLNMQYTVIFHGWKNKIMKKKRIFFLFLLKT